MLYYNRPSFLAQSPQLYKEELVLPFEKVYEIGPAFRAEESRTQRHLSEITSIDIEEAFVDYNDVMDTLEALLKHVLASVKEKCQGDLEKIGHPLQDVPKRFERLAYTEVVKHLQAVGEDITWGEGNSPGRPSKGLARTTLRSTSSQTGPRRRSPSTSSPRKTSRSSARPLT